MKKTVLLIALIFAFFGRSYGQNSLWVKTSEERVKELPKMERATLPSQYDLYTLNLQAMKNQLQNAPLDSSNNISNVIISFPNSNGQVQNYRIYEAPIMEKGLSDKFPDIKSYSGKGVDDSTASIRFSTTLFGLHVMSLSGTAGTFYIDTYTKDLNNYIVYNRNFIQQQSSNFKCLVQDETEVLNSNNNAPESKLVSDGILRQYRLAMACTIEYAAFHVNAAGLNGGTVLQKKAAVLSAMAVTMTRVNGLYERDMSLRMNLIANNDLIIFITSDTFTNNNAQALINESQTVIDGAIGLANYDIGHTVSTGGGGLAQVNSPCSASKARGITGSPAPVGDPYDIDYVAHEMGHQFGSTHTFNNDCGGNRSDGTAVEPGSGTTIMAYAGICAPDVQGNSDAHFHAVSIAQMTAFVLSGGTCSNNTPNGNTAPIVNAGLNYVIPKGTAFVLKGVASDVNNDALTYCWEQINNQISTQPPLATAISGPNFRSRPPSISPNRYMPVFSEVLSGNLTPTWEVVPNVARPMSFALTVRDNRALNGGQTKRDDMNLIVANVGPFIITNPSAGPISWDQGSTQTITWDVAGTTANNINTANVTISLSTDGGVTFSTLVANTPNDGSEVITVPNTPSTSCRILIEAVGNIFYAVSKNISIGYACNGATEVPNVAIADGVGANSPGAITTRTINFPENVTINNMKVSLGTNHTWVGDLVVKIKHPDGTQVTLWNRTCNNPQNSGINVTFSDGSPAIVCASPITGTYSPIQALSAFNGKPSNGIWTLTAQDFYVGDSGSLTSWGIDFGCTLGNTVTTFSDLYIYPNPSKGTFNIQFSNTSNEEVLVNVFDIRGRSVYQNSYIGQPFFNETIHLNNFEKGIYLVTITNGTRKEVKKIAVE
ncbi:reprolysin-like metallopeptidase [Flavobacterium sp.]